MNLSSLLTQAVELEIKNISNTAMARLLAANKAKISKPLCNYNPYDLFETRSIGGLLMVLEQAGYLDFGEYSTLKMRLKISSWIVTVLVTKTAEKG